MKLWEGMIIWMSLIMYGILKSEQLIIYSYIPLSIASFMIGSNIELKDVEREKE